MEATGACMASQEKWNEVLARDRLKTPLSNGAFHRLRHKPFSLSRSGKSWKWRAIPSSRSTERKACEFHHEYHQCCAEPAMSIMSAGVISRCLGEFLCPCDYVELRGVAAPLRDAYEIEVLRRNCKNLWPTWLPMVCNQQVHASAGLLRAACKVAASSNTVQGSPLRYFDCNVGECIFMMLHGVEPPIFYTAWDLGGGPLHALARAGSTGLLRLLRSRAADGLDRRWTRACKASRRALRAKRYPETVPTVPQSSHVFFVSDSE